MIKYTFHLQEGNVVSETDQREEEDRIEDALRSEYKAWFSVRSKSSKVFINKEYLKAVVKEIVVPESPLASESNV